MGALNNAAHHFELLRSCDSSDPFNSRCGECRPDSLESTPEQPDDHPFGMYLDGISARSSWGRNCPSFDSFLGFRICTVSGKTRSRMKTRSLYQISFPEFSVSRRSARFRGKILRTCIGAGDLEKKNGQESLPVRKANPGRLAALWIRLYAGRDFIRGSGDHRPAPIKLEHNSFRVSDYCKRITGRFRVCELLCSISPE